MPFAGATDRGADRGGVETGQRELDRDQMEARQGGRLSRASTRLQGTYRVDCNLVNVHDYRSHLAPPFLSLISLYPFNKEILKVGVVRAGTRL